MKYDRRHVVQMLKMRIAKDVLIYYVDYYNRNAYRSPTRELLIRDYEYMLENKLFKILLD